MRDPLKKLPDRYGNIQNIIDNLPLLIKNGELLEKMVINLPNNIELVSNETNIFVIQALYRAYTFVTSAYLLEPSYSSRNQVNMVKDEVYYHLN